MIITILTSANHLFAQKNDLEEYYTLFAKYYASGDFINAEKCLLNSLEQKERLKVETLIAIYNNLGVINNLQGRYEEALRYLNLAQIETENRHHLSLELADIYINKARIYGILKESDKAIEYLEQGIKIYVSIKSPNNSIYFRISTAYLNLGLTYYERKEYKKALEYLAKCKDLKLRYNLSEVALAYLNIAKTYAKNNDPDKAQRYFLESIISFNKEFGIDYYRTSSVLFDYGLFLRSIKKNNEALEVHHKALSICLKKYGAKHTFVSLAYKHLGDYFFSIKDYKKALEYYQKSLIAVVVDFNDPNIDANPTLNNVLFDIRLLENLKSKAKALEAYSEQQADNAQKGHFLKKSFETIELCLELIARIRSGYITPESKFYLAENEKKTYFFAVQLAQKLFETTNDISYENKMYSIACLSKAAVLRNEIAESNALSKFEASDSLIINYRKLLINISSYNKLVENEIIRGNPNKNKVDFWKASLFDLNRKKEKLYDTIKELYPNSLLQNAEPLDLKVIQSKLKKNETIIEYFLSNALNDSGQFDLYFFVISRSNLTYRFAKLDSVFIKEMRIVKEGTSFHSNISNNVYVGSLYSMYENLIKPVEADLVGKKVIVVPDEEIAYLPFDSFIKKKPESNIVSFDELPYLIYDYTISYGYTSSLLSGTIVKGKPSVVAFQPEYSVNKANGRFENLVGANNEIVELSKLFKTERIIANEATESKFMSKVDESVILHLAMHSSFDKNDSKYSYLVFDSVDDKHNDGRLYNYEIGNTRIKSPMVVLSACNTGDGNLIEGEGVMSLARGFFLAGVPSVICTYWDVNDNASEKIMKGFYYHLSKGDEKSEALRKSKLEYLSSTSPAYSKPSYWSAYEVLGDNSPIVIRPYWLYFLLGLSTSGLVAVVYYFIRSKRS